MGATASGRRPAPQNDTREQVIAATVDTIAELGFDLASSREILRRAGFTWGVLQYHFGSREGLLLAVLEDSANKFDDIVATLASSSAIARGTAAERLEAFFTGLDRYYGTPQYIATLEIIFNISHNPETRAKTLGVLSSITQRSQDNLALTINRVLGPAANTPGLDQAVFHVSRGLSVSTVIADLVDNGGEARGRASAEETAAHRRLLARGLALLIEEQSH